MKSNKPSTSHILIETFVEKALKDAEDESRRTVRNLVDLAMQFSKGRFQKTFFTVAQTMLQNEHSAYYDLFHDLILHVEQKRLLKFGMNVGYNSCTAGASTIRRIEAEEHFNVPWCISVQIEDSRIEQQFSVYQNLIAQGQEMGIYTWLLFAEHDFQHLFALADYFPDSAFILFCEPEILSEAVLEELEEFPNIMVAVHYKESVRGDMAATVCRQMREHQLLYSLYYVYEEADLEGIQNGDLFYSMQQLHPVFTGLYAGTDVSEETRLQVYNKTQQMRNTQVYPSIIWDLHYDLLMIDQIVSDDSCTAWINKQGKICSYHENAPQGTKTIFDTSLKELLRHQFPKDSSINK